MVAPPEQREALRKIVERIGESGACRLLDVTKQTIARVLAGLPIREGTVLVISKRLEEAGEVSDE